jgi:SAM-dependent methyltransferase
VPPPRSQRWPKQLQPLTAEQLRIKEDFYQRWLEILPRKYAATDRFGHLYPVRHSRNGGRILEIGAGLGEHIAYEDTERNEYFALELRPEIAATIRARFPQVRVIVGDCQQRTDFPDHYFDRVNAIHVLEHLPNLPAALRELHRVLKPRGDLCVVLPCEGGLAYSLARRFSAQPMFEKLYKTSYDWFVKTEHINTPQEVIAELRAFFQPVTRSYFPLRVPLIGINLIIGMTLTPLELPASGAMCESQGGEVAVPGPD